MPLVKTPVTINFAAGLDTKTDPYQVQVGKFLTLSNSVFNTAGRLTKRNGFANITSLPNTAQTTLTTLNDNLIATGSNLYAFSEDTNVWLNKGIIQPIVPEVLPLVRVSTSQSSPDSVVAPNGLICLAYIDNGVAYYQISDSVTGQQIIGRTNLPASAVNPRVFLLGRYFIITFVQLVSSVPHLRYISIPMTLPASPAGVIDVSTSVSTLNAGYDAVVANNNLYLSWAGAGDTVKLIYLSSTLILSSTVTIAGHTSSLMSVVADTSGSTAVIWASFWDSSSTNGYSTAYDQTLGQILAPTQIITTTSISEITSVASDGVLSVYYENINNYSDTGSYPTADIRTDFISSLTIDQSGTVVGPSVILRSVGLASKAFTAANGNTYMLVSYGPPASPISSNQPSYFLIDSTGAIYLRLAYSNGSGYAASQVLPSVCTFEGEYCFSYLIVDFLATVNKNTSVPANTNVNAIYTQTGVNLAKISINTSGQHSSEIAGALHLTGGQLWEYDGVKPVEHGFQVWPEDIAATITDTGGSMTAQKYYYVFTYEWTDNQGNLHRSAPSVPLLVDTTGMGDDCQVDLFVPTLRLTYKVSPNPVRIVGYRWSTAQQVYYQFTGVTTPTSNDTTIDYVDINDTQADSAILGQTLLYTTGGVVEDIAAPASIDSALYKNRLFLIDAEDRNLLWFSKQVIEATPVEMSDLFTIFVAPTSGAQGSTGPMTALSAMDDKLIIFKKDAIYYMTGIGPDNTGSNNDFSDPIYITSSVGCANPNSIVLMPNGLMFQSDKGIWLLGRDLSTSYIGAPVELYNDAIVENAQAIPGTNQVRFVLDSGITLMFDYFFGQWGTFSNISAISATLYQGLHTYLNSFGQVFQESIGAYLDGSNPVLMGFTTSWISLAGLRGFERFYFGFLLGTYFTPFKLNMQIAYDFNPNPEQGILITPDNAAPNWGDESLWGSGGPWGGVSSNVFQARFFPTKQKCQTFQISITEVYDSSLGVSPGQGLSLSGMNVVIGAKKGYNIQKSSRSFG